MGFAALGRATGGRRLTYGARPKEGEPEAQGGDGMHNRTEVASANAMAAEMAAVWCLVREVRAGRCARRAI